MSKFEYEVWHQNKKVLTTNSKREAEDVAEALNLQHGIDKYRAMVVEIRTTEGAEALSRIFG